MQDDDFEKQVQRKLAELKFRPEGSVWMRVEEQLHQKEKRRRRIIWFPVLLLCIGIGGYMLVNRRAPVQGGSHEGTERAANTNDAKRPLGLDKASPGAEEPANQKVSPPIGNDVKKEKSSEAEPATNNTITLHPVPRAHGSTGTKKTPEVAGRVSERTPKPIAVPRGAGSGAREQGTEIHADVDQEVLPSLNTQALETVRQPNAALVKAAPVSHRSINVFRRMSMNVEAAGAVKVDRRGSRHWEWGFTLEAGRSSINNGSLKSLLVSEAVADVNSNAYMPFGNFYLPPSKLKPGIGFAAGIQAKRQLGKRTAVEIGVNYSRLATSHRVGGRVDSAMVLRTAMMSADKRVDAYYRLGNTSNYTNYYHFIELPVSLVTQLLPASKVPIYYNLGFSVSRLVSSNALHFDGNARIYYKDNSLFNKTQVNVLTGLNMRMLTLGKLAVNAGPQLQYGITNLLKEDKAGGKHLLLIGLKANILIR